MDALDHKLTAVLRERGQRVTQPRLRIHRLVAATPRHVTADQLHDELPDLSPATIYSTLELLEELGVVRRVASLEGVTVYDSVSEPHGHAVCRRCGAMFDIAAADTARSAAPAGFEIERAEVQLIGLCARCA
jgi:Fe2+ or Zn2+ uptake regulation protein